MPLDTTLLVSILFSIVGIALPIGLAFVARKAIRAQLQTDVKRDEAWSTLAEELGGEIKEATGSLFTYEGMHLAIPVEGRVVRLDHHLVSNGQNSVTYTRARTESPQERRLTVHMRHGFSPVAKLFGGDVKIGDEEYDETFVIRTDAPDWLPTALPTTLRQAHMQATDNELAVRDGTVFVSRPGVHTDLESLRMQIGLCAALATAVAD